MICFCSLALFLILGSFLDNPKTILFHQNLQRGRRGGDALRSFGGEGFQILDQNQSKITLLHI